MPPHRTLIGLAVGSGGDAADAVAVRADGVGLGLTATVAGSARVPVPPPVGDARRVGDALAQAARQAAFAANLDFRSAQVAGFLGRTPLLPASTSSEGHATPADWVAEQTGLTVVGGFRGRDAAAGGTAHLITPAADFVLFRDAAEDRVLVHLGAVTSVVLLPAGGKVSAVVGFEAGPGNRLLDDITHLGTRGRDSCDSGGKKAVQGRCLDDLLANWLSHPHFARRPPKALPRAAFGTTFLTESFEHARAAGATLHDLLCTATHFVARCVGDGVRRWVPARDGVPRRVFVSGGGVRNGFLWKLLERQFDGAEVCRLDALGVPAGGRNAAAAAVLAALTLDGVAGNLPLLTGAAGGRLIGTLVPGDERNWAAVAAWVARQTSPYLTLPRAS